MYFCLESNTSAMVQPSGRQESLHDGRAVSRNDFSPLSGSRLIASLLITGGRFPQILDIFQGLKMSS